MANEIKALNLQTKIATLQKRKVNEHEAFSGVLKAIEEMNRYLVYMSEKAEARTNATSEMDKLRKLGNELQGLLDTLPIVADKYDKLETPKEKSGVITLDYMEFTEKVHRHLKNMKKLGDEVKALQDKNYPTVFQRLARAIQTFFAWVGSLFTWRKTVTQEAHKEAHKEETMRIKGAENTGEEKKPVNTGEQYGLNEIDDEPAKQMYEEPTSGPELVGSPKVLSESAEARKDEFRKRRANVNLTIDIPAKSPKAQSGHTTPVGRPKPPEKPVSPTTTSKPTTPVKLSPQGGGVLKAASPTRKEPEKTGSKEKSAFIKPAVKVHGGTKRSGGGVVQALSELHGTMYGKKQEKPHEDNKTSQENITPNKK